MLSAGLFALGIALTLALALFFGLLFRGPGEIAADETATTNLSNTAFYRDTGIVAPARPNG